jgi:hypothetical protein
MSWRGWSGSESTSSWQSLRTFQNRPRLFTLKRALSISAWVCAHKLLTVATFPGRVQSAQLVSFLP